MDEELLEDFDTFATPQSETISEVPAVVETQTVEDSPLLNDFDTFSQPAQIDPIDEHRPQDTDDESWMDIKKRVNKFLGDYTPLVSIPLVAAEFLGEFQQKEGSQISEAMSVKSRLENIEFAYSDLSDTLKSAAGNKESEVKLKDKRNKLNDEVVSILDSRGIEAYNDNGSLKIVSKDADGNEVLKDLDEEMLDSVLGGFKASAGEIGGAIMGAGGAAVASQRALPITTPPQRRAIAGVVSAGIGGYAGAATGRATDLIRNTISLNKEIDAKEVLQKSLEAGTADIAGTAVIGAIGKGVGKTLAPIGKVSDRLKTLFKDGDIQGAKRVVKEDYALTDENIDTLFESVKKDIDGLEDLTGDDLLRAKLTAAIQQQPQGKALITSAIRNNVKAAIETSKEIDFRAKQVLEAANRFSKKPSQIGKSIKAYEKAVGKNYSDVRNLIDEALPNYKADLDTSSFTDSLLEVNKRVIDPDVRLKVENLAEVLGSQPNKTVGDLIETRQLFNKFYGKNLSHFENTKDKEALFNIQKTIDNKIDEAINSIDDKNIANQLKQSFTDAKDKYAKMFKTQDTATYTAIFRKGASENDIGKALIKYSKATDKDLESVLGKLSPVQRTKAEFSILKQMVDTATIKGEAKAVDFTELLENIGTSKAVFKTPEAKQFLKNIESYDKKFGKDIDIQKIASGVAPKEEKNIATSLVGKILMKISSLRFEALQRMMPTEQGRRLSLQKSIESALEKSRTPREFFFEASKIKGMPNKERIALKKAVKEIGEKEELLKKELMDQQEKNRKAVQEAQQQKKQKESKKILSEQEFKKVKWDKAKEAAKKQKLNEQARKAKDDKEVPIGGSEDEAKQAVKNVFAKNKSEEAKIKSYSKEDIAELERIDSDEANQVFSKFADNLAVGAVAGVEKDEKGNITFSPEKFVIGLGGYTAVKALVKNPKAQEEFKEWARRALDDLESKKGFNYLSGKQSIVSDSGKSLTKPKGKEVFHPISKKTYILADDGILYFHRKINNTWKESININQKKEIRELAEKGEKAFMEARKETPIKINTLEKLPNEYIKMNLSKSQEDFLKRAIPKKKELKKETQRYISKKAPSPKKIYRGEVLEGEERIGGGAKEGYGLYTTVDKKLASKYGNVSEMNPLMDLPKKPLVFSGMNEFEIWEQTLDYKVLKYRRASEKGDISLNEVVDLIDPTIDGVQIGSGISANSGTYWVKFPPIEEFRSFEK